MLIDLVSVMQIFPHNSNGHFDCALLRYAEVVESVKNLVEDSERFVGKAPASQP